MSGPPQTNARPLEARVDDDALRCDGGAVSIVAGEIGIAVADRVAEQAVVPSNRSVDGLGVGIEEQLGRVEALPRGRVPRAVDSVAIAQPGAHTHEVGVPHLIGSLVQRGLGDLIVAVGTVEQAELDRRRVLRKDREVDPSTVPRRTQGVRAAGSRSHRTSLTRDPAH